MPIYTLYCLNDSGRIARSEPLEADNDEAAVERARALNRDTDCELWLRDRRVAHIPPAPSQAARR